MIAPADDLDKLMAVMASAFDPVFGEAWTRRQVADALLTGNCRYFLISPEGRPVEETDDAAGFYLARTIAGEAELLLLAVSPDQRRRGLGKRLLTDLRDSCIREGVVRLFLEMRRQNPAGELYQKFGFVPVGERPNYYRMPSGERIDAVTLALRL